MKNKQENYEFDTLDGIVYNDENDNEDCFFTEEECIDKKDVVNLDIPNYYIGKKYKYEARKVVEDFDLTYNIGTAVTYLLRAYRKHDKPTECITKAMAHLKFELDILKND